MLRRSSLATAARSGLTIAGEGRGGVGAASLGAAGGALSSIAGAAARSETRVASRTSGSRGSGKSVGFAAPSREASMLSASSMADSAASVGSFSLDSLAMVRLDDATNGRGTGASKKRTPREATTGGAQPPPAARNAPGNTAVYQSTLDAARKHGNPNPPSLSNVVNVLFTNPMEIGPCEARRRRPERVRSRGAARFRALTGRISMVPAAPDARILDVAHLHRQTFGDRALEREVLALFEQQCLRLPPLIAAGKNPNESADAAHNLKGAARAVGAWRLALLAEALETALGEGRPAETLERLNRALEQAVAAVRGAVAELRSARGAVAA